MGWSASTLFVIGQWSSTSDEYEIGFGCVSGTFWDLDREIGRRTSARSSIGTRVTISGVDVNESLLLELGDHL